MKRTLLVYVLLLAALAIFFSSPALVIMAGITIAALVGLWFVAAHLAASIWSETK
jgi:hypothetical protein